MIAVHKVDQREEEGSFVDGVKVRLCVTSLSQDDDDLGVVECALGGRLA